MRGGCADAGCGMRLTPAGLEHRTAPKYHPELPRPHRCCSPQQTSYGWSIHSSEYHRKEPTYQVSQPISFAPYILQPTLLWYVTQMVEKSVSSWILCSTTN